MLEKVKRGPPDPMFDLKARADADTNPHKIDLGVGIYRSEAGSYQELGVVKRAKETLHGLQLGHDYAPTIGDAEFLRLSAEILFGERSTAVAQNRISSVQTISGTGANSLAASLLAKEFPTANVYIGIPTWGNHIPIFQHVGLEVSTYSYLNASGLGPNLDALLNTVRTAPSNSIFVLQGCCHNPTGVDLSIQQWKQLASELTRRDHLIIVDIAYQGLGDGLDEDAAGLRALVEAGLELLVCQSFSKNFALYGERCGALHVVSRSSVVAADVKDRLRSMIRHTYSSSPAYGSRLVTIVLSDGEAHDSWAEELGCMRSRLKRNRYSFSTHVAATGVPGEWSGIIKGKGLFSLKRRNFREGSCNQTPEASSERHESNPSNPAIGPQDCMSTDPTHIELGHFVPSIDDGVTFPIDIPPRHTAETDANLCNPLISSPTFVTDAVGRRRWLGPSSTWAYSQQAIRLLRNYVDTAEINGTPASVDAQAFVLDWPSSRESRLQPQEDIPSRDYAIYLTNTVKFHLGQTYHLFDEGSFLAELDEFYNHPTFPDPAQKTPLWLLHFLLVLALGQALLAPVMTGRSPAGGSLVARVLDMLPDTHGLYQDAIRSIELLCCLSLYLQSIDHRNSAYLYIGQGLRIALTQGLHREHDMEDLSINERTRLRNVWWTCYILDRKFSSLMGAPSSVHDSDITVALPAARSRGDRFDALAMHVRITKLLTQVLNTVYNAGDKLDRSALADIKDVLQKTANMLPDLSERFPLRSGRSGSVSRVSATLNLCFHQVSTTPAIHADSHAKSAKCIVLAARPILICLIKDVLVCRHGQHSIAHPIKTVLEAMSRSAQTSLDILSTLQSQHLLETFLPFDLEQAFSSIFTLTMTSALPLNAGSEYNDCAAIATDVLDTMILRGNRVAKFRKNDLEHLQDAIRQVQARFPASTMQSLNNNGRELQHENEVAHVETAFIRADAMETHGTLPYTASTTQETSELFPITAFLEWEPAFLDTPSDRLPHDWLWTDNEASVTGSPGFPIRTLDSVQHKLATIRSSCTMAEKELGTFHACHSPHQPDVALGATQNPPDAPGYDLHKRLEGRHVILIALGGALGTGLLVGTGSALVKAGPAGILIDYSIVDFVVFLVMTALGEMVSFMPSARGFGGYATRFVDPALGFATGYVYFFKYLLATPNQLSALALLMKYWIGDRVSPAVFITVSLFLIILINSIGVRAFGEFEFWLSSLKVIIMIGVIVLLFVLAVGGGPMGDRPGFRYWQDPGAFAEYKASGPTGRLFGLWSAMVTAVYAFSGTELVGVTVGEAKHPRLCMPKAIRLTFYRILFFYITAVFLLGMVSAAASLFVVAIKLAKIEGLDYVVNGCLVVFVFSAANLDLYIASRTLYSIAADGKAPRIFNRTTSHGVPFVTVGLCSSFCGLAYLSTSSGAAKVFGYLTNVVTIFGLLTWVSIFMSHIFFCQQRKAQRIDTAYIPYRAPFGLHGSCMALVFLVVLILIKGAEAFIGSFDARTFVLHGEADLITDVPQETVAEERARFEQAQQQNDDATGATLFWIKAHRTFLAWLF
ncbi:Dicarboxylic amino acid permease [Curvularia clavata]|uniref:Dicarboxylic amino acid permease n=1 Tax=Curvularia clavata TaxID=95742 RepID=A0A9Q9DWR0_CURCL|nr:Dicarboxylic amino acid permease [Curvularia clavata]